MEKNFLCVLLISLKKEYCFQKEKCFYKCDHLNAEQTVLLSLLLYFYDGIEFCIGSYHKEASYRQGIH